MLHTITVIQYFVTVRCLVRHCTGCEVNCNWFTESAYQIYISYPNLSFHRAFDEVRPVLCCARGLCFYLQTVRRVESASLFNQLLVQALEVLQVRK